MEKTESEVMVYSKLLKKPFDSIEELKEAEKKYHEENDAKLKLVEEKKSRAKEIEDAYKHSMDVRKEARQMIKEADDKYYALRNKFVEDYGSYHLSYYNDNGKEFVSLSDMIDSFFKWF
jgi:hypothetical protein